MSRSNSVANERPNPHAGISASVFLLMAGLVLAASAAEAQTIGLYELARFDLSATASGSTSFIGSNPVAVGWNGTKLYVAGLNSSGSTTNTSIIEVTNAGNVTSGSAAGFVTPTYSSTFGALSSAASRGYTGLSMKGSQLAASFDAGSNTATAFQMFDASTNSFVWNLSASGTTTANIGIARGFAGPDFDPGYQADPAQGSGLGWLIQGQGRRFLNNASTGASIYTTTAGVPAGATQGMIINTAPTATNWRDMAFNPSTGDLYTRRNNSVTATLRTGSNANISLTGTAGQSTLIWTSPSDVNNVGTNIGYMNAITSSTLNAFTNTFAGDLLVYNNRASTAAGQSWTDVIQFLSTTGTAITPSWTFLAAPSTSTALYDFEWDSTTQTLAVVDYTNRNVSIFSTAVPEPSSCAVLAAGAGIGGIMALRRRRASKN